MHITELYIENYKCFKGAFNVKFSNGVNVLVGDNEAGKSTILESINLALSGLINGRYLKNELSQYLFNFEIVNAYVQDLKNGKNPSLPIIVIEVFFEDGSFPLFEGTLNHKKSKAEGVSFKIEFDQGFQSEYQALIQSGADIETIPIEYYQVSWKSFARDSITSRLIPIKSVLIDSSAPKYHNGSDIYISKIIRDDFEEKDKVGLSQAYRKLKEGFIKDPSIVDINTKISGKNSISEKKLHISIDLSTQNSWEKTLMTYLDDVPFPQVGKGEQSVVKTNLALEHNKSQNANVVLVEEPENHLSHSRLNKLVSLISKKCDEKQVIISTHSNFVANKLGLEHLILLNNQKTLRLEDLTKDTYSFFKKLPGYNTLRLLLSRKAVLVEGDSDELVFQKAYMKNNSGKLPIEDGIDVISVKLTFLRFLEISKLIDKPTCVITDNDGEFAIKITKKYTDYLSTPCIKIFADDRDSLNTLEPQFVDANSSDLEKLRTVLGITKKTYPTDVDVTKYMENNKTGWALKVFETEEDLTYPTYILEAVKWCNE